MTRPLGLLSQHPPKPFPSLRDPTLLTRQPSCPHSQGFLAPPLACGPAPYPRPHSRPAPLNLLFSEPRVPAAVGSAQGLRAPSFPEPPAMRLFLAGRHAAPRMPRPGRLRARRRGTAEFEGSLGERVGPRAVPSLSLPPHATPCHPTLRTSAQARARARPAPRSPRSACARSAGNSSRISSALST